MGGGGKKVRDPAMLKKLFAYQDDSAIRTITRCGSVATAVRN